MTTSPFSTIMAFMWCCVFELIGTILRHKTGFVHKYGVKPIMLII